MSLAVLHCRNTNKTQIGKQPSAAIRRFFIFSEYIKQAGAGIARLKDLSPIKYVFLHTGLKILKNF